MQSILIIDDDEHVLKSLARVLRKGDYGISCFEDPEEALVQCAAREFDLVLSDQTMPSLKGTALFARLSQLQPNTRRILISGYSDFSSVTEAFNKGTIHKFVLKPWDNNQLKRLVAEQLEIRQSGEEQKIQRSELTPEIASTTESSTPSFHGIITNDPAMKKQLSIIRKTATSDAPFFISGETGTGKELIARAIHLESDRANKPFVALNCANLTENLLESQLFGHLKGAFTGAEKNQKGLLAEAESGTLFLDEVTEIPQQLQAKLLRVIQEREFTPVGGTTAMSFDVKIISASALSLQKAVELGKFREDLRYRLEVMPIYLPPLRARGDDIKLLFDYFLKNQFARHRQNLLPVDDTVYENILAYHWPGNIRELVNVCTYIAALTGDDVDLIRSAQLPPAIQRVNRLANIVTRSPNAMITDPGFHFPSQVRITRESLEQAITEFSGQRESIARHFGISRMTLWRKMKRFGLT